MTERPSSILRWEVLATEDGYPYMQGVIEGFKRHTVAFGGLNLSIEIVGPQKGLLIVRQGQDEEGPQILGAYCDSTEEAQSIGEHFVLSVLGLLSYIKGRKHGKRTSAERPTGQTWNRGEDRGQVFQV